MGPIKSDKKNWCEIKQQKKQWKETKMAKKMSKAKEEKRLPVEVTNGQDSVELQTCSIAVPGSILENTQSLELRAYVAGQIARAACIYKINEIIIFDDVGCASTPVGKDGIRLSAKTCIRFARLLQYLECPQYLRKNFFPIHKDLQYAGLMNPLDTPHHLRQDDNFEFREGVTTDKAVKDGKGTYVNAGLLREVLIDKALKPGLRVTVKIAQTKVENAKKLKGTVVSPDTPVKELNIYWGYTVRIAHSLSEVFSKSPYKNGYDLTLGTSDKGENIDNIKKKKLRSYTHSLIVFGGLQGLEDALENDDIEVDDISLLFDYYINVCPQQGSRIIRTEEAVLITLAELRRKMFNY